MIMLIQDEARQLQQLISFDFEFLHLVLNASLLERGRYFVFSLQECPYEAVMASECFFNCVPHTLVVKQLFCAGIVYKSRV